MAETLRSLWSPTEPHGASKEPYIHTGPYGALHTPPPYGPSRRCVSPQLRAYTELMVLARRVQNVSG